jgi:predicted nucleic acid-binding protein
VSTIVLDASVAVALVVDEPLSSVAAEATAGHDALVPEAFWVEVANGLLRKVRRQTLSRDRALEAFDLLRRFVGYSVATEPLGTLAMELSLDLRHPVYDCVYLAAAMAHGAPLLTADRALHAAAVAGGYGDAVRLVG